ncbi:MAG: MltA domain-containing protein [Cyanobacteria bacterium P01_A01_bin.84]
MKKIGIILKRSPTAIASIAAIIAIPLLSVFIFPQSLVKKELAVENCRLQRWRISKESISNSSVSTSTQQKPVIPPLLPTEKPVFPCCQGDMSCFDKQLWGKNNRSADKQALITSLDRSLKYLQSPSTEITYKKFEKSGITRNRVIKSLQRFRQLLLQSKSATELNTALAKEFTFYQSLGRDNQGTVLFTAYYEPLYIASRVATPEFRYPIYKLPPDIKTWSRPHPTRLELEGADGLQGSKGKLKGLEIFWFRDRLEPVLIQIQGSAKLQFIDGSQTSVGYAGNVAHNYQSIGKALVDDGKIPTDKIDMPAIFDYFKKYPQDLDIYIPRDPSFVFFQENFGAPAQGSIQVALTPDRSIATDKSLMPPGALAMIRSKFPFVDSNGNIEQKIVSRYVLDQDTGGAIKGPGRVDYFVGTGKIAGDRAGVTISNGQLYYLLLK